MEVLTPAERRAALLVALLLALGAAHDLWRAARPSRGAPPVPAATDAESAARPGDRDSAPAAGDPAPPVPLDLNRATARDLDALPGVGPVLAGRIVAYRERHGPLRRSEELMAVRGIGPRLYARLAPRVTVRAVDRPPAPAPASPPASRAMEPAPGRPER